METTTNTPVRVLRSGTYNTPEQAERLRNTNKRPIVHADGSLVRFAEFHDPQTGGVIHTSMLQDCIWDGLEDGDLVHLNLVVSIQERAVPKADGSAFIERKPKLQLKAVKKLDAPASKATRTPATVAA